MAFEVNGVVWHEEGACFAVNGGEGGYLIIHSDGLTNADGVEVVTWKYSIVNEYGEQLESGDAVNSPRWSVDTVTPKSIQALHALISFLVACAESKSEYSENYNLFPQTTREWAEMWSDELSAVSVEMEEEYGVE